MVAYRDYYENLKDPKPIRFMAFDHQTLRVGLSDPYIREKIINTVIVVEEPDLPRLSLAEMLTSAKIKYRPLTGFGDYGDF